MVGGAFALNVQAPVRRVDMRDAGEFMRRLRGEGVPTAWIGGLIGGAPGRIHIDGDGCTAGTGRGVA
jgi:hypothetical protein